MHASLHGVCELVRARAFMHTHVFTLLQQLVSTATVFSNLLLLLVLPKTVCYYVNVSISGVSDVYIILYDSTLYLDT
jgi:hypothetical protein